MDPEAKQMLKVAGQFSYLGIFFGVAILLAWGAGHWLDGRFHTGPWLSLVGLLIGVAAGFNELIRISRRVMRATQADDAGAASGDQPVTTAPPPDADPAPRTPS